MYLHQIELCQYRNYHSQTLALNRGINLLLGTNGQGKTNLLEAIYYLAAGTTFRGNKDGELIQWNQPFFRLRAQLQKDNSTRIHQLELYMDNQKHKQLKINGVKYKSLTELHHYLRVVLFAPDDLKIVKGSPAERRHYLDLVLCQLDKGYQRLLRDYERVVAQRNNLLKEIHYRRQSTSQLELWNTYLIRYGSHVIHRRLQLLKQLIPTARRIQQELTQQTERFTVTYHCSLGSIGDYTPEQIAGLFQQIVARRQQEEIQRGNTLWGPHRDDLVFYLNGADLRRYGSQGQQRTGILSLKIAELYIARQCFGEYPLLLLDDVMSELDDSRRHYLLQMVRENQIQTIITGANIELLTDEMAQNEIFLVEEGKITR